MNAEDFKKVVDDQLAHCRMVLLDKGDEYAPGVDRLSNFKMSAILQEITPIQALGGLMAKHVVALYDFIIHDEVMYSRWEEKITDTINYLLLLEALIRERKDIF